ncbi:hypothetical protein [Nonomuraea sp. NPDC001023]|uniref:hypothetical protein n=1 Tax=unclassified Nonomuraea TaxID=2593643 RepID=UPI003322E678
MTSSWARIHARRRTRRTWTTQHRVVRGAQEYHQIQFGHRVMFVRSEDVVVTDA